MAGLGLALILCAVGILALAMILRRRSGLPWARVVATDAGTQHRLERPLFSARLGLTGKPDYILQRGQALIPVEVKPNRRATEPYPSDLMQLAAYLVLLEETTGAAPPYGLLRYADTTFQLRYTATVRDEVLATLDEMRDLLAAADVARNHNEAARCRGCGFRAQCDDALA
ncbi:CRISPR-associated protein Cas4 [Chloroflexus sp.]|uniref:CRISPR-associated protein Cas4 n=1 Tax=Chloroflexus sp. TaxID=1904827 RepID=UPI00298EE97A|nr:CRISPR-associated protein Cas4 [Chloroflexus sp.]MCX7860029.1 CRISPR-associated protein Cas4 [Chloroflexus sp.]MDW8404572.1 CRISPR-associated protein Cas4 [Chloroflexus sp.]